MDLVEGLPVRLDSDTPVSWHIRMDSGWDPRLVLYSKHPDTGALTHLAENDDYYGLNSAINWTPAVGVEYVIGATAFSSGFGTYQLYLTQTQWQRDDLHLHDGEEIPPVGGAGDDILVSGATIQATLDTAANPSPRPRRGPGLSDDVNDPSATVVIVTRLTPRSSTH